MCLLLRYGFSLCCTGSAFSKHQEVLWWEGSLTSICTGTCHFRRALWNTNQRTGKWNHLYLKALYVVWEKENIALHSRASKEYNISSKLSSSPIMNIVGVMIDLKLMVYISHLPSGGKTLTIHMYIFENTIQSAYRHWGYNALTLRGNPNLFLYTKNPHQKSNQLLKPNTAIAQNIGRKQEQVRLYYNMHMITPDAYTHHQSV